MTAILLATLVSFFNTSVHTTASGFRTAPPDSVLASSLRQLVEDFDGRVGIFVRHLETGFEFGLNEDSLFPTASMIKLPILVTLMQKIEDGDLAYSQPLVYKDSLLYPGEDILGSFKHGETITLDKVAMLMITTSDNTAALWCQSLAGTGTEINRWLAEHGFIGTRMNSRTPGREADWERYGWGQTTPKEIATLLQMVRERRAVSPAASDEMTRILSRIYWDDEALSQIPPYIHVMSKQGAVNASKSEVALVSGPNGDFVFSVTTDNQSDTRWEYDNDGYVLIRRVAALLWQHFEPDSDWRPAAGAERFRGPGG